MKKYLILNSVSFKKIISFSCFIIVLILSFNFTFAEVVKDIPVGDEIKNISINPIGGANTIVQINNLGFSILHTVKVVLSGLILIYIVYIGVLMIVSMGSEDKLKNARNQLYYTLIAFLFINIPGQLYDMFTGKSRDLTEKSTFTDVNIETKGNIFVNFGNWGITMEQGIIPFVKVLLAGVVVIMLIISGINMILSKGDSEKAKKAKSRFLYSGFGLVFLGVIEAWTKFAYTGDFVKGQGIFAQLVNVSMFFAGPTAIFFLILGGFYYITSAGDEAKAKKGIAILKNTILAVIILLASYSFLKDLTDFTF